METICEANAGSLYYIRLLGLELPVSQLGPVLALISAGAGPPTGNGSPPESLRGSMVWC